MEELRSHQLGQDSVLNMIWNWQVLIKTFPLEVHPQSLGPQRWGKNVQPSGHCNSSCISSVWNLIGIFTKLIYKLSIKNSILYDNVHCLLCQVYQFIRMKHFTAFVSYTYVMSFVVNN